MPLDDIGNIWRHFLVVTTREGVLLLVSSRDWSGVLINVLQCRGQPPTQRCILSKMLTGSRLKYVDTDVFLLVYIFRSTGQISKVQ